MRQKAVILQSQPFSWGFLANVAQGNGDGFSPATFPSFHQERTPSIRTDDKALPSIIINIVEDSAAPASAARGGASEKSDEKLTSSAPAQMQSEERTRAANMALVFHAAVVCCCHCLPFLT